MQTTRLYLLLALLSLPAALLWQNSWQSLAPKAAEPDQLLMHFYRHAIGQLDGRDCPSWPVCSLYATQAVNQHGLLIGSWLAMDRLIHEGDDLRRGNMVNVNGEVRLYDPLSHNDFWIKGDKE